MKKIFAFFVFALLGCDESGNVLPAEAAIVISKDFLIGKWNADHVEINSCEFPSSNRESDTTFFKSTYSFFEDSVYICINEIARTTCSSTRLTICDLPNRGIIVWSVRDDSVFVSRIMYGIGERYDTTIAYALQVTPIDSNSLIIQSHSSVDTVFRDMLVSSVRE